MLHVAPARRPCSSHPVSSRWLRSTSRPECWRNCGGSWESPVSTTWMWWRVTGSLWSFLPGPSTMRCRCSDSSSSPTGLPGSPSSTDAFGTAEQSRSRAGPPPVTPQQFVGWSRGFVLRFPTCHHRRAPRPPWTAPTRWSLSWGKQASAAWRSTHSLTMLLCTMLRVCGVRWWRGVHISGWSGKACRRTSGITVRPRQSDTLSTTTHRPSLSPCQRSSGSVTSRRARLGPRGLGRALAAFVRTPTAPAD